MFEPFQVWLADKAPSFDEFLEIYGKIKINAAELKYASGLYLGYSAIDHSCAPNAAFFDNGTELTIRARDDIENFSGMFYFAYINVNLCCKLLYLQLRNISFEYNTQLFQIYESHTLV